MFDQLKAWLGLKGAGTADSARSAAHARFETNEAGAEDVQTSDLYNPFPDPVVIEIRDVFDLHTIHPKDVRRVVEQYLREAHARGFPVVRIVHGKGKGVQREIVRGILARTAYVTDWTDAPPEAGGWGATIARLVVCNTNDDNNANARGNSQANL